MNTGVLQDFRVQLAERRDAEVELKHVTEDLKARQLYLTPTGPDYKALGANETERENVMLKRFADDAPCQDMRARVREIEIKLAGLNGNIDGIEAARRDEEWQITRALVEVLGERRQAGNPGREAAAFAGLYQAQIDASQEVYQSSLNVAQAAQVAAAPFEEIPF